MTCAQVWIIRDAKMRRSCTVEDHLDPAAHIQLMLAHYESLMPDNAPYVASRYVLASTIPARKLSDLFINHIEAKINETTNTKVPPV